MGLTFSSLFRPTQGIEEVHYISQLNWSKLQSFWMELFYDFPRETDASVTWWRAMKGTLVATATCTVLSDSPPKRGTLSPSYGFPNYSSQALGTVFLGF